jgi:hypothetical protein
VDNLTICWNKSFDETSCVYLAWKDGRYLRRPLASSLPQLSPLAHRGEVHDHRRFVQITEFPEQRGVHEFRVFHYRDSVRPVNVPKRMYDRLDSLEGVEQFGIGSSRAYSWLPGTTSLKGWGNSPSHSLKS